MSERATNEAITPHVLALPFPEHGHINPMLHFCGHLASQGVVVTFVLTEDAQAQISSLHPWTSQVPVFRFATIGGGFHRDVHAGEANNALTITQALISAIKRQRDALRQMVVDSHSSNLPVSCFLVDFLFMSLANSLCDELCIRKAMFFPSNGWFFSFGTGNWPLLVDDNIDCDQTTIVGGIQFNTQELEKAIPIIMRHKDTQKLMEDGFHSFDKDALVIINTFEKLEETSLKATICPAHVCYVGPIMPINSKPNILRFEKSSGGKSECLTWIDKQEEHSVLYISFGSTVCLNSKQLEELAFGLQQSKWPFLWVMRNNIDLLPERFLEQINDKGFLVKWAPQLDVLGHPSVGGFLTHCGWNSIIESIYMGVPLLCFPFFADQHINSLLVTKTWNFGIPISKGTTKDITRDSIRNSIDQLMKSTELRQQALTLKMYAHETIEPNGTSHVNMEKIINVLRHKL